MKVNKANFEVSDKKVNASFKKYLRRNVQPRLKFYIGLELMISSATAFNEGFDIMLLHPILNIIVLLIAWYVTSRHLWTLDYFLLYLQL